VFLYRQVLEQGPGWLQGLERVKRKHFLPVVLTPEEVRLVLGYLKDVPRLMSELIYGTGMRVMECMQLRIKDIDFRSRIITVRTGKGGKDQVVPLPRRLDRVLQQQVLRVLAIHKRSLSCGRGDAPIPYALARKHPSAARSPGWQYVFPSTHERLDSATGRYLRWHASPSTVQRAFQVAGGRPRFTNMRPCTASGTPSLRISSPPAATSAPSSLCSGIATSRPP
jgi:integrase